MKKIGSYEAKTCLSRLLAEVEKGSSFTITKHGKAVANLVPAEERGSTDVGKIVEEFRSYSKRQKRTLGGISIREMIEKGRR